MPNSTVTKWLDLGERTLMTYAQAVAGLLLADSAHLISLGSLRVAAVAALPAGLAAAKSALALGFGTSGSASLLPASARAATDVSRVPVRVDGR